MDARRESGLGMGKSFAEVHPELVDQWSDKNLPLTPHDMTYGSSKVVWWKGECGHEWQTSVKARSAGEGCPICRGFRVVKGVNDLATLYPTLALEWSEKNQLKPTEVTYGSRKKVWWKCSYGHTWKARISDRVFLHSGCVICEKEYRVFQPY